MSDRPSAPTPPNDVNTGGSKAPKKRPADEVLPCSGSDPETARPPAKKIQTKVKVLDICASLGLKPGDRIEVRYEIKFESNAEEEKPDDDEAPGAAAEDAAPTPENETVDEFRWESATLLAPDGRVYIPNEEGGAAAETAESVAVDKEVLAIHRLEFDPLPESRIPHKEVRDVCFLSDNKLFGPEDGGSTYWRREGNSWDPVVIYDLETVSMKNFVPADEYEAFSEDEKKHFNRVLGEILAKLRERLEKERRTVVSEEDMDEVRDEVISSFRKRENGLQFDSEGYLNMRFQNKDQAREQIRTILDGILGATLAKVSSRMQSLPAAVQAAMADRVAAAKERLLEKMLKEAVENPNWELTRERATAMMREVSFGV